MTPAPDRGSELSSLEASLTRSLGMPRSELHRRWMELEARGAPDRDRVALAFECCHAMVFATARRITGSPWEAEDVTQSVFEALAGGMGRIREPSRLAGFLKSTTVRIAMRRMKRSRWRRNRLAQEHPVAPPTPARGDTATLVQQLLPRLDPQERAAVVLRYVEMHTHDEVAELMRVSVGTARRRLESGRRKLVALLTEDQVAEIFGEENPS